MRPFEQRQINHDEVARADGFVPIQKQRISATAGPAAQKNEDRERAVRSVVVRQLRSQACRFAPSAFHRSDRFGQVREFNTQDLIWLQLRVINRRCRTGEQHLECNG